ncbi:MAG: hypothetical protein WBC92_12585 [Terracidiphilus sp.]
MKNSVKLQVLGALVLLGAGWLAGCKSAPPLTKDQAVAMIQAKEGQSPAAPLAITVNDTGMQQGVSAKYWFETKRYPNGYWGDFTLTPDGKKVLKLSDGSDVIHWRPESPTDPHFVVLVNSVVANHPNVSDVGDVQTVGDTRTVSFSEDMNFDGVPDALASIAHNPGNQLSTTRMATFVLTNGAWTLQSIM